MGLLGKIFGEKVKVPEFQKIDIDKEIENTFKSISAQLPEAQQAFEGLGTAQADVSLAVLERVAPGTRETIDKLTSTIQEGLSGELPDDVIDLVQDQAAARSFDRGIAGSEAAANLTLRDFGLTSLDRINRAQGQATQAISLFNNLAPAPNVSSFFLNPAQRLSFLQNERNAEFQRDNLAAQAKAAPDPFLSKVAGFALQVGGTALGAKLGSLGGGGQAAASAPSSVVSPAGIPQSDFSFSLGS